MAHSVQAYEMARLVDQLIDSHVSSKYDIEEARRNWESDQECTSKRLSYAMALAKSSYFIERRVATLHFEHLLMEASDMFFICLYNLALTYYSVQDYETARAYCETLYREQPDSGQVKSLHTAIAYKSNEEKKKRESSQEDALKTGLTAAAIVAAGVGLFFALKKKK